MRKIVILLVSILFVFSCRKSERRSVYFESPVAGLSVPLGKNIYLKTDAEFGSFDSIRFYVEKRFAGSSKDTTGISASTQGLEIGGNLLSAWIFNKGDSSEITTNIQVLPDKAPQKYSYEVVNAYPHDTSSYTEGLEFHDGILYESDGGLLNSPEGASSLRKAELKTGKVLKQFNIDNYFAEGITVIGNKIVQLSYREGLAFEYDKNTFQKIKQFPFSVGTGEGWGACFDGTNILNSDGSNTIHFLNKDTYREERSVDVYDNNGPVQQLNELEYIEGKIFSNVWMKNRIVIIDPKTGIVEAELNLDALDPYRDMDTDLVLNGIAWDAKGRRLFVTGKKWDKLYEIKINRGN